MPEQPLEFDPTPEGPRDPLGPPKSRLRKILSATAFAIAALLVIGVSLLPSDPKELKKLGDQVGISPLLKEIGKHIGKEDPPDFD